MELIAINLARLAAFVEIDSLDPKGRSNVHDNLKALVSRYGFASYPTTIAEMSLEKGIQFTGGNFQNIAISNVNLFQNGIVVDTRSSTDDSMLVFDDIVSFAREINGAVMTSRRHHFVSQIIFRSNLKLAILNPLLQPIADRLSRDLSASLNHPISFEPTAFLVGPENWTLKVAPHAFSVERRAETPFNENTYFSAAPLPTSEHINILEDIEMALSHR